MEPTSYRPDYKICLFNTSHKAWAKPNETHIELDEAEGWAYDEWISYDRGWKLCIKHSKNKN